MTTGRSVALDAINHIRDNDAFSNLVLPEMIRESHLSSRDAGHVTDLVYGSLRWRGFLDAILDECVTGSTARVDSEVLELLRLATYELVVREEPPHIVNEWVTLAKRRFRRAAGFVNATLRAVSRSTRADWNVRLSENRNRVSTRAALLSHPEWIVRVFTDLVGEGEVDDFLASNNVAPAPTLIALPGLASIPDGANATTLSPYGFVSPGGALAAIHGVADRTVRVQDEGSQLAALALVSAAPIRSGEQWLDLCAGPGGKTALLAAIGLPEGVHMDANEIQPHRAQLVRDALTPFGDAVTVSVADGVTWCDSHEGTYDRILVDAPCTGLGALRRRPESRWRKSESDLDDLVPLQQRLLDGALRALKIGGVVAYVTCSPHPSESVDVIADVVSRHPGVEVIDTSEVLLRVAPALRDATRGSAVQLYPHRHHTDAMFIQLIRRTR